MRLLPFTAATCVVAQQFQFQHPGVFIDNQQLQFAISSASAGVQPFALELENAKKFTWVNDRTNATGPPADGIIACGFFDHPDAGCSAEGSDSQSVLLQSYLWLFTGNETWANRAITIMNHYAQNLKMYNVSYNGPLEAAWASDKWARAAELIAHGRPNSPWARADQQAFARMLQQVTIPAIYNGSCYNGNWEMAMIEGMAGIAVFAENVTLFQHAVAMWESRVPGYFYISEDGPQPAKVRSCGTPSWFNQLVFNSSVDGVCQETCRDFGHMSYGLASMFNALETFRAQGIDLYTPHAKRLAAALEFHAGFLNKGGYPKPGNVTDPLVCNNTVLKLSDSPTFQVGLTGLMRVGYTPQQLPQTTQYVQQYLIPSYYNQQCDVFMRCYEALTHGAPAPGAGPLPPGVQPTAAPSPLPVLGRQ